VEAEQHTTAGGLRLAYQVEGHADKPPMVLLHALGERGSNWPPVKGRFAERFRVSLSIYAAPATATGPEPIRSS